MGLWGMYGDVCLNGVTAKADTGPCASNRLGGYVPK